MSEPSQENLIDLDDESYFSLLVAVAAADGEINADEMGFIQGQASVLNQEIDTLFENPPALKDIDVSKITKETRALVIRDCISLAYIDGSYNDVEKELVNTVAEKVGFEQPKVDALEQWLKDYWDLMERGANLLSE
jgi:tellurite resistance protein